MDIEKFASSLDEGMRAKLDALSQTNEARALSELFSDAELARASQSGDEQAPRAATLCALRCRIWPLQGQFPT